MGESRPGNSDNSPLSPSANVHLAPIRPESSVTRELRDTSFTESASDVEDVRDSCARVLSTVSPSTRVSESSGKREPTSLPLRKELAAEDKMPPSSSTKPSRSTLATRTSDATPRSTGLCHPSTTTESSEVSPPPAERPEVCSKRDSPPPSLDPPDVLHGERETPRNSGDSESTERSLSPKAVVESSNA